MYSKEQLLSFAQTDGDRLQISRVLSCAELAEKYGTGRYTCFYDPRLFSVIVNVLNKASINYKAFGGYENAERLMLYICGGVSGEDFERFPIDAVFIKTNEAKYSSAEICHRDVLGSLLSLGIKREKLGDIFSVWGGYTVITCSDMTDFIVNNLYKVGGQNVSPVKSLIENINPLLREYLYIKGTVASKRLDCIVSLFTGKSRSSAAEMITGGFVRINYFPRESPGFLVSEGDVISIKGFGKANIRYGGESRKGRIFVTAEKYN